MSESATIPGGLAAIKNSLRRGLTFKQVEEGFEVTNRSLVSGQTRTKVLSITQEQIDAWQGGTLIQKAFPQLSDDDREFIMTGITAEEWESSFAE